MLLPGVGAWLVGNVGTADGIGDSGDPDFAGVVLLADYSDRGEGTDASFANVVLLLDNSTGV